MREQHLSDEAIAAFADDVLPKGARERARRHTAGCPECAHAVAVQREAVWALRAAPAPSLPIGLLDRLRDVPVTTPIQQVPSTVDEHGNAMFATVAGPAAAFVPMRPDRSLPDQQSRVRHWARPVAFTAASLAAAGVVTGVVLTAGGNHGATHHQTHVAPVSVQLPANSH
jgi:anti-sigma factor RsiW